MNNSEWKEKIWDVIDNYFENTEYNLSHNQLDSYNTFLDIQVSKTIRQFNPITLIYNEDLTDQKHKFSLDVIIGGSFSEEISNEGFHFSLESTSVIVKNDGKGIYITKPIIQEIKNDSIEQKLLYPNEARLKNLTYKTDIQCDIFFIYKNYISGNGIIYKSRNSLGNIPIMLHSKACILNKMSKEILYEMGECPYDQGGYFIVDGKEKVIIAQERQTENRIFVNINPDDKTLFQGEVRSVKENSFEPAQIIIINIKKNNKIYVKIPDITEEIPLFILFKTLGLTNDEEIVKLITNNTENKLNEKIKDYLYKSILETRFITNQYLANDYIKQKIANSPICGNKPEKSDIYFKNIIYNKLFPHVGDDNISKAYFLAYMINDIFLRVFGLKKKTDRDSFINKRIDISGFLIGTIFRDLYFRVKNDLEYKINISYYSGHESILLADEYWVTHGFNENFLTKEFRNVLINRKIMDDGFLYAFKNCWGLKNAKGCKDGIVQDLNRLNYLGYVSHIRRINMPLSDSAKIREPHSLHSTSFGTICPYETPDGGNIGLRKNFTIFTQVTFGTNSEPLIKCLTELNTKRIFQLTTEELKDSCRVFLNENIIGIHYNPDILDYRLKLLRRNGLINIYTSITWYKTENILKINTSSGRLCRPLLIVNNKNLLLTSNIIDDVKSGNLNWKYLVGGTRNLESRNPAFDEYDDKYYNVQDTIQSLEEKKGCIEYIDTEEIDTCLIAMTPDDLLKTGNKLLSYTHCEIHPSLMLGVTAACLPLIERNQAPRNQYSCAQSKQALGVYATNFRNRMDTKGQIMYYPEKPLVQSKISKYLFNSALPQGINAIVAIGSYSGYNQEDSILINRASLDRGLFRTATFKTFSDREEIFTEKRREYFRKPNLNKTENIKNANYSKIGKDGFIKEGVKANENDILMSKVVVDNDLNTEHDNSVYVKKNDTGIVDKVYYNSGNESQKYCKIRLRKEKIPEVGDKFCSRFGQKGTIGMVIEEIDMPFTKDGIVPDIIINPHAIPSRMTIGQLLETLLGKVCANSGLISTQVQFSQIDFTKMGEILETLNYEKNCNETLYNGRTGSQLKVNIFIGPTFYQRLTHQVAEKFYSRGEGAVSSLIRQPVGGRSLGGGLRIGEMERDAILAHGISGFLKETMMERSDKYNFYISDKTGLISIVNKDAPIYNDFSNDSLELQNDNGIVTKMTNGVSDANFVNIETPFAFKLLLQEFECMSIGMRLIVDKNNSWQEMNDEQIKEIQSKFITTTVDFDITKKGQIIGKQGNKLKSIEILYSCNITIIDNEKDETKATAIIIGLQENIQLVINQIKEIEESEFKGITTVDTDLDKYPIDFLGEFLKPKQKLGVIIPLYNFDDDISTVNLNKIQHLSVVSNIQVFTLVKLLNESELFKSSDIDVELFLIGNLPHEDFNLGALFNVGVKSAIESSCTYVILHSPELLPDEKMISEYLVKSNEPVYYSEIDGFKINTELDLLAKFGILKINIQDYLNVNGFPNHMFQNHFSLKTFLDRLRSFNKFPEIYDGPGKLVGNNLEKFKDLSISPQPTVTPKDVFSDDYTKLEEVLDKLDEQNKRNYDSGFNEYQISEQTHQLSGILTDDWFFTSQIFGIDDKKITINIVNYNFFTTGFDFNISNKIGTEELKLPDWAQTTSKKKVKRVKITNNADIIKTINIYLTTYFSIDIDDLSVTEDDDNVIYISISKEKLKVEDTITESKLKISDEDELELQTLNTQIDEKIKLLVDEKLNDVDIRISLFMNLPANAEEMYYLNIYNEILEKINTKIDILVKNKHYDVAFETITEIDKYLESPLPSELNMDDYNEKKKLLEEIIEKNRIGISKFYDFFKSHDETYIQRLYLKFIFNRFLYIKEDMIRHYNYIIKNLYIKENDDNSIQIVVNDTTQIFEYKYIKTVNYPKITYNNLVVNSIDIEKLLSYISEIYIPLKNELNLKYKDALSDFLDDQESVMKVDLTDNQFIKTKLIENYSELNDLFFDNNIIEIIGNYIIIHDTKKDILLNIDILTGNLSYVFDDELNNYNKYYSLIFYKLEHNIQKEESVFSRPTSDTEDTNSFFKEFGEESDMYYAGDYVHTWEEYQSEDYGNEGSPEFDPNSPEFDPGSPSYGLSATDTVTATTITAEKVDTYPPVYTKVTILKEIEELQKKTVKTFEERKKLEYLDKIKTLSEIQLKNLPHEIQNTLQFNYISSFSTTENVIADDMSKFILSRMSEDWRSATSDDTGDWNGMKLPSPFSIIDATACIGGNTLSFAKFFSNVHSIELQDSNFKILEHNVKISKEVKDLYEPPLNGDIKLYNGNYEDFII